MTITDSEIKYLIDSAFDSNVICYDIDHPEKPSAFLMCSMFEQAKKRSIYITDFIFPHSAIAYFSEEKAKEIGICRANINELDINTVLGFNIHYVTGFSENDTNKNYIEYLDQKGGYLDSRFKELVVAYDKTTKEAIFGAY